MEEKGFAIIIDSFDGYSDLWETFFEIFDHYWPNCRYNIYLICNDKDFEHKNITLIKTGKEINWFHRTISALEKVNEKYILFMLEDYFISKKIKEEDIDELIKYIDNNNIFYYQVSGFKPSKERILKITKKMSYPISLQMAIWRKDRFLSILKEMQNEKATTPWDFEKFFIKKYENSENDEVIEGAVYDKSDLFGYHNGVLQGKWIRDTLKFYNKNGIRIDLNGRKKMSFSETFIWKIKKFFSRHLSTNSKSNTKKLLKKLGFKFMT